MYISHPPWMDLLVLFHYLSYLWLPNMAPMCPQCGAHRSTARARDASDTTTSFTASAPPQTDTQRRDPVQPDDVDPGPPKLGPSISHLLLSEDNPGPDGVTRPTCANNKKRVVVDPDRPRLELLICHCPCLERSESGAWLSFRIYLCTHAIGLLNGGRPEEAFDRAATKMLAAIRHLGEVSPQVSQPPGPEGRVDWIHGGPSRDDRRGPHEGQGATTT